MEGNWDTPDLAALLEFALLNIQSIGPINEGLAAAFSSFANRLWHLKRDNSPQGSRRNVEYHYDLSNEFYRLWLDPTMTYSAALFTDTNETLEEAQRNKYRHLARLLALRPDGDVLEIGCGWGGFAMFIAREYGSRVTAVTLSEKQAHVLRERVAHAGLNHRISVQLGDYREITGVYDKIASIEMLEAVGEHYWPVFFQTIKRHLQPDGIAGMQVITIDESRFEAYRRGADFIQRYIFPGGMLPSRTTLVQQVSRSGLTFDERLSFGASYARTLVQWRDAFRHAWPAIASLGFSERFKRMWDYYLAYCEAGFRAGSIDVVQFRLSHTEVPFAKATSRQFSVLSSSRF